MIPADKPQSGEMWRSEALKLDVVTAESGGRFGYRAVGSRMFLPCTKRAFRDAFEFVRGPEEASEHTTK